jgi:hypothetical protein
MNVLNIPVETIAKFSDEGIPTPIKFKWVDNDESQVTIKVQKIIQAELIRNRHTKDHYYTFLCESCVNDTMIQYEIRYDVKGCKWVLYRM